MPTTIESLELEVQSNSSMAVNGIDALSASLSKLRNATKGGVGLTSVVNQLKGLNSALSGVDASNASKLDALSNSLSRLSALKDIKISSTIGNQLRKIGDAVTGLNGVDFRPVSEMATAMSSLSQLGKSNLSTFTNQLKKLPELAQMLKSINIEQFADHIQKLSDALTPLASRLNTVSTAFAKLPSNLKSVTTATTQMATVNNVASKSYLNLWAKLRLARTAVNGIARVIGSWITNTNTYIENVNLFTVSMGEYANEAKNFAEQVGDVMGIDPGEWMRNQGVFMTITEGFGVASDRAYTMSKNLTQLGYDLSSFFNISYEDAMQKLTSGISGELEPLRRLGYDLSQARLQQEALTLGIDKSISSMTQAEKAQIRYHAIMTQVTVAQGDMARTLDAPANQLRILQSQLTQVSRALGNLFIPLLNKVLPYLIAIAKVLRLIINIVAKLFNITLPEMEFPGISDGVDNANDLDDAIDKATDSAKKLKNAMTGIDELNIISPDDSSGVSGLSGSAGGGLDFDLPEYTFMDEINDKIGAIVDKFKEWLGLTDDIDSWSEFFHTRLGRILILIGAIGAGLLLWKFSKTFLNSLMWLQNLKNVGLGKPLTLATGITLSVTGLLIEWAGLISIIQDGIDALNLGEVIGGAIMTTIGGSFIGRAASGLLAKAGITSAAIEGGMGTALAGALFGGGIAAVAAGLPAFVVGVYSSIKEGLSGLSAFLTEFGATLTGAGAGAIGAACGAWAGPIGIGIGALIGVVVGALVNLGILIYQNWAEIKEWASGVKKLIQAWFSDRVEDVKNFPKNLKKAMNKFPEKLKEGLAKTSEWLDSLPDKIKERFDEWGKDIEEWFDGIWDGVREFDWASLGEKMGEGVGELVDFFTRTIPDIKKEIRGWIEELLTEDVPYFFTEFLPEVLPVIIDWLLELPSKIQEIKGELVEGFITIGESCLEGIIEGLNAIGDAWTEWKDGFVQGFKDALGIHSPSTVFEELASHIIEGLILGIDNNITDSVTKVKEWANDVVEQFTKGKDDKGIIENFKETAESIVTGFGGKINTTYPTTRTSMTTWASRVKDWFSGNSFGGVNRTTFSGFAGETIEGFKTKIGTSYTNTKTNITTWASKVKTWFSDIASKEAFSGFATDVINGFKSRVGGYYTSAQECMNKFGDNVKSWFTDKVSYSAFYNVATEVVNGFKNGIGALYKTCKDTIKEWGASIINWFKEQLGLSASATGTAAQGTASVISDSLSDITPTLALALDTSAIQSFDPSKAYGQVLSTEVQGSYQMTADGFVDGMETFYREYVEPTLSRMAEDVRRQADKEEQTIVQVGNRVVTDAVNIQKKANGYSFVK